MSGATQARWYIEPPESPPWPESVAVADEIEPVDGPNEGARARAAATALSSLTATPSTTLDYLTSTVRRDPAVLIGRLVATMMLRQLHSSSVVPQFDNRERVKARFRLLRRLHANHDNEGAAKPNNASIDRAMAFVDRMRTFPPFFATIADDGSAVIEFETSDRTFFADITFAPDGHVELYRREAGKPSEYLEGALDSPEVQKFLEDYVGVFM
jgi:hypothetical protein